MDRGEMLEREDEAWRGFEEAIAAVPGDRRTDEGVVPGWSTQDLLWHCAFWANYTAEVLDRIRAGDPDPDTIEDTQEDIIAQGRGMSWEECLARAGRARERVRAALTEFDDDLPELAEQWFRDDTFDHYDEHAASIRAFSA
jgi:hypothetical protein